ncbi:MAG: hypothetical protein Q8S73_36720 [Deltaproteobacteria bacterium]|nr:hypothetical protein [Myxococcales bacterium]MDP3219703.1 hypothetical protein [Deltaproteobacteria bacterium]
MTACHSCGRAVPDSALDRILFGWVAVAGAWICKPCDNAPRCPRPDCDRITTRVGVPCGARGGESRPC